MRINPIISRQNDRNISYKSNYRVVKTKRGSLLYQTTTFFFREGFNWNSFVDYIEKKYQNVPTVNFYDYACSSGQETYSIISLLLSRLGKSSSQKFFPILARDIDEKNIYDARNNPMGGSDYEKQKIETYLRTPITEYFYNARKVSDADDFAVIPRKILTDRADFKIGNILKDIDNLPAKNTILFCRNVWPYMTEVQRKELLEKITAKFDDTSLVVIGDFDISKCKLDKNFEEFGFNKIIGDSVFSKKANNSY